MAEPWADVHFRRVSCHAGSRDTVLHHINGLQGHIDNRVREGVFLRPLIRDQLQDRQQNGMGRVDKHCDGHGQGRMRVEQVEWSET